MNKKPLIISWALYDLANQFFAVNIISFYFPLWLTAERKFPELLYSLSFGISMFLVAICAPVLGTIADIRGRHKPFLIYLTLISIIFTFLLGVSSNIFLVLVFFAIANFGCQGAIVFYNALLGKIAPKERLGLVSGLGRMFGYTGAILALLLTKPFVAKDGYQAAFIPTSILFLIFALPCMIFVKEQPSGARMNIVHFLNKQNLLQIFQRLKTTLSDSYKFVGMRNFLKAAFFVFCAVNAIILFMTVYATRVFVLTAAQRTNLFIFSTIFAILSSIISGCISDIIGCKRSMIAIFFLWTICFLAGALLRPPFHWLIGALAGMSLGATWVVSRAFVIKLVPKEKLGEVFGLFNLIAYLSAIVGPLWWGGMRLCFSYLGEWGYRLALLSLILFMAVGFIFIIKVPSEFNRQKL